MRPDSCETFAAKLVEYADGELPEAESQAVRDHLSACPHCRATVDALNRSLGMVQAVWADVEADLAGTSRSAPRGTPRRSLRWAGLAAAGVLLAFGMQTAWKHTHHPQTQTPVVGRELTPEQAELLAARAGVSAQMLGAAEYLAENGGAELARERLQYLVNAYPETDAAAVARSRLKLERNLQ